MGQIMATLRPSSSTNSENTKKRKRDNSSCSKEDEIIITSSLPSSSTPRWKHDAFLSFCGKDTRTNFTDHLYYNLKWKGNLVFRDEESLERGKCISLELLQAIQESRYAIVIFSANYASSKWCLRELAEIVEWEKKKNLTIIPIFYHVDPSDVRNQSGTFAKAFAAYEKDPNVDIKEIDMWRTACRKVGNIAGEHINGDRHESTIIQQISGIIFNNSTMLNILTHANQKFVGINSHVEEMMNLLHMESNDARFIGIHGMGGVGKTTLAKIIYDKVSCQFEGRGFISCTREKSTAAPNHLASLQKRLLYAIMKEKIRVYDPDVEGIGMIMKMLQNKRVFIVLDDVDSHQQLTTLAGDRTWFGPGSRVIITCRDSHLLITHEVNDIFKVQLLQTSDALQLFSLSAFRKTNPPENYMDLSMNFVHYAGGLPLALTVLGRFLFGRTIDAWKSASNQLEANPKKEIFDILKISFDGLEESQQNLFLDMACCWSLELTGEDYFKKIYPAIDFEVLVDKSLLIKSYDEWELEMDWALEMHDLLEKMGQEIVHRQCPDEPGRRSRLFRAEDVVHVLKNNTGTDAIEMLVLNFYDLNQANHRFNINAEAFSKKRKLRFLLFDGFNSCINWRGNPLKYMPSDKLQLLYWQYCPSESWPRSFQPKTLVKLSMAYSRFKQLWKGLMVLPNLKILDLSHSFSLIEISDLSGAPNLEKINLEHCGSLRTVHPSIGTLKQLIAIVMPFTRIKQLWNGTLVVLPNLKILDLSHSFSLIETPDLSGAPNLEKINLEHCGSLRKVHPSIGTLKQLIAIVMPFTGIKQLWNGTLVVLNNLKYLNMSDSSKLIETPDLSVAPNLEAIDFSNCTSLCKVHPSIRFLKRLESLSLNGCSRLVNFLNILGDMTSLERLSLPSSEVSIFPSVIYSFSSLRSLRFDGWSRLEKLPDLSMLERLGEFKACGTAISQISSINLIPKRIYSFGLEGGKRMPRESRDLVMFINDCSLPKQSSYPTNHDIGAPVEYEMEEKFGVQIDFHANYSQVSIQRCSLGSRIPEWVHNKSNGSSLFFDMCKGSSLKTELDGNTMLAMGIAIFIVCQIPPVNFSEIKRVAFPIWLDDGTPKNPCCKFSFALSTNVIFNKPIVLWKYFWQSGYLDSWKLKSLDKRKISTTAEFVDFAGQARFPLLEVEVKEWGLHLVCPDDAALGLGSDLNSFVNIINLGLKCGMTRNDHLIHQEYPLRLGPFQ